MSIDGVSGRTSYIGTSIINLRNQLNDLTQQLASGRVSTTYAGQGADRGFALSLRAQVSSIDAFKDTATNVNTRLNVVNLALQGMSDIGKSVKSAAGTSTIVLNNNGQTSGQITAQAAFANAVSLLNSQSGDRYLFSGRTTDTPATVPADVMLNGTGTQAGLTQLINERRQADQGVGNMGRLAVSSPPLTTTVTSLAEDGSSFGLKLGAVTSSLTGATVTQPAGVPPALTVDLGAVNPNDGDKITFNFNLPDGTTEQIALTATTTNPPPAGSFLIGVDTAATTANLQATLTTSIKTLGDTALVAASAITASDNFFNPSATIAGSPVNNQDTVPAPITGATLLSGTAPTDSLATSFAAGDTITVNGTPITFVASGATGNQLNVTDSVQTLLAKIDSITGTSTPSTVERRGDHAAWRRRREPLGHQFEHGGVRSAWLQRDRRPRTRRRCASTVRRLQPATNLIGGTSANTVSWYTGETGSGSGARHRGRARRSVGHGAVRRARQRAGVAVPVAEHRGVCRGHHQCQATRIPRRRSTRCSSAFRQISRRRPGSNRSRTCRRNSPARRPRSRRRPIARPSSREWRRPCSTRSRASTRTRSRPRSWRCRPVCRLRIKPPRCSIRPR